MFEDPGWEKCGKLLDEVQSGKQRAIISAIQLSELYTPFERTHEAEAGEKLSLELEKLGIRVFNVDDEIGKLSAKIRSTERSPDGRWLALADSVILATAIKGGVDTLYTTDPHFALIRRNLRISAPFMPLDQWVKLYSAKGRRKS